MTARAPLLLMALAAILIAALAWTTFGQESAPPEPTLPPNSKVLPRTTAGSPQTLERIDTGTEPRTEITAANATPQPAHADHMGTLRGRVVSKRLGTPLARAKVTITRRTHSEFWLPNADERNAAAPVTTAVTDGDGRFEVPVPAAVPLDVAASAPDHATARRDHVFAGNDIEVRLAGAASLQGTLTLATDGSPITGALVVGRDDERLEQCRTHTDTDGRFRFDDLQPGLLTVEITPRDHGSSSASSLLRAERAWAHDISCQDVPASWVDAHSTV